MKTLLLNLSFLILGLSSYSQNWSLINPNRTVFYQHIDSIYISNTIVIDSTEINGVNTNYYTGYAAKYCDTCQGFSYSEPIIYRYAKEFLGFNIEDDIINDQFNLDGNIIKQHSSVNDTWTFSSLVTATTISKAEVSILGVLDSVKTIELTATNDTIIISKNYGVIRYPDFENNGKYYQMVGYHEGQYSYGDYLPNFWRTYDFNVGDVFCYESNFIDYCYHDWYRGSIKILENLSFQDTIRYKVKYLGTYDSFMNAENCFQNPPSSINKIDTILVVLNSNYENNYGIQKVITMSPILSYPYPIMSRYQTQLDQFNQNVHTYITSEQYSDNLFGKSKQIHHYTMLGDSLLQEFTCISQKHFTTSFGATLMLPEPILGEIYECKLVGAISNGDILGSIYNFPDDLGFEEQVTKKQLNTFPNPATDQITIPAGITNLKIFSNIGELVMEIEQPNSIIDVSQLSKGLYFIVGKDADNNLLTSKLIIQ